MAATATLPRTKSHPIAGDLPALRRDRLAFLTSRAREHGDFAPLRFGFSRALLISDPSAIEQVLRNSRDFIKSLAYQMMRPVAGNGLLLAEGDFWMRQRRLTQPAFQRDRTDETAPLIGDLTGRMLAGWQAGETREIHGEMMRLTAQVAGQVFFGADLRNALDDVARQLLVLTELLTDRLNSLWVFVPDALPTPSSLRVRRTVKKLDEIIFSIIEQRRRNPMGRDDLFSRLLSATDEDGRQMTDRQLRDHVMTFFLAGHETTSLLLSWTLYLLAKERNTQARVRAELMDLEKQQLTAAAVANLPFLNAVLNETLRLYPPVFVMGRKLVNPCEVAGRRMPAGMSVLFSQWIIHRDSRYFDQADLFLPERWLDGLSKRLPRYAFFPFGGGQRICIGANFAMMEAALVLAVLLRRFAVEPVPGREPELWPAFTLRPRTGVYLKLLKPS